MFELITGCSDYNTPMIHNLKPHIPFDNLLICFTLRQGWGSRDCTAVRGLTCSQCGWGSTLVIDVIQSIVVAGSLLCPERFCSGDSGFPLSLKTNMSNFQFDVESVSSWLVILRGSQVNHCMEVSLLSNGLLWF